MPPKAARSKRKKKKLTLTTRKKRFNTQSFVMTFVLMLFASTVLLSGVMYKRLNTVFASAQSTTSKNIEQQDILTVLLLSAPDIHEPKPNLSSIRIILIDTKDNEVTLVPLDLTNSYEVQGKFGKETPSNSLALANSLYSDSKEAQAFFVKTIENNLMLKVDRYVFAQDSIAESFYRLFAQPSDIGMLALAKDFALGNVSGRVSTNLTDREMYFLVQKLSQEPTVTTTAPADLHKALADIFFNSNIADEKFMISILNGAQVEGVANYASKVVENAGGRVTFVGNAKNDYSESVIVTDNPDSHSAKYMMEFFDIEKVESKAKYSFIETDVERADITVVLGLDFTKKIF